MKLKNTEKCKTIDHSKIKDGQFIYNGLIYSSSGGLIGKIPYKEKTVKVSEVSTGRRKALYDIVIVIRDIHGWLKILERSKAYTPEEIEMMEDIDKEIIETEINAEKDYRKRILPKVQKSLREAIAAVPEAWRDKTRLRYLDQEILRLDNKIERIYDQEAESQQDEVPRWLRDTMRGLKGISRLERRRRKLAVERWIKLHPQSAKKNFYSPEDIALAMSFPMDQLITVNKKFMAPCPFHNEKTPSFHINRKTNYGYCFGCGWSGGPIKFLMEKDNIGFREAMKALLKN